MGKMSSPTEILKRVESTLQRKKNLYDGHNTVLENEGEDMIKRFMYSVMEEVGEVCSAIIRDRPEAAKAEIIDVMHSCLLLYIAIEAEQ